MELTSATPSARMVRGNHRARAAAYVTKIVNMKGTELFDKKIVALIHEMARIASQNTNSPIHVSCLTRRGATGKRTTNSDRILRSGCQYGEHAEMSVLRRYDKLRSNSKRVPSDMVVIRVNAQGIISNSKPCEKCLEHIQCTSYRIRHIYYSGDGGVVYRSSLEELQNSPKHRSYRFRQKGKR